MRAILLVAFLCLAGLVSAASREPSIADIKPILTSAEKLELKNAHSTRAKKQFVETFWERRNPSPGSPENEFKIEYEHRLQYVKHNIVFRPGEYEHDGNWSCHTVATASAADTPNNGRESNAESYCTWVPLRSIVHPEARYSDLGETILLLGVPTTDPNLALRGSVTLELSNLPPEISETSSLEIQFDNGDFTHPKMGERILEKAREYLAHHAGNLPN